MSQQLNYQQSQVSQMQHLSQMQSQAQQKPVKFYLDDEVNASYKENSDVKRTINLENLESNATSTDKSQISSKMSEARKSDIDEQSNLRLPTPQTM